ncbi:MAG: biopolymer transporter ExbD [Caulobacteraceae bacterium]|jgi:biopolymer transport protein ExbD|nr:biopolymer transporter ExbD [Caulobacteraceae bacterium]
MGAKLAGGGKAKYELGQNADINVTPFVDVMLVLLIIFMVAAPMATVAIKIDLPPAQAPKDPTDKKPTFLSIRRGGEVYVVAQDSTQKVELPSLASVLNVTLGANATNQSVLVRADRDVRYREFMAVVNQLQKDGFYKVGLISENLG